MYVESAHPRDEDGRWTEKQGGGATAAMIGEGVGSLVGGYAGDEFARRALSAAISRFGINATVGSARFIAPALRLAAGMALGGAAATGVGAIGAALAMGGYAVYERMNRNREAAMTKRAPDGDYREVPMDIFLPLAKLDEEQRIIVARAAVEEPDRQKEIMDYDAAKTAFEEWSKQTKAASKGKSLGNVRVMHQPRVAGRVVDIRFNDKERAVDVAIKVDDASLWEMCKSGSYTGLSIGGGYARKWRDPSNPMLTRYAPSLSEISIVDRPCIPSATFQILKADGSSATRPLPSPGIGDRVHMDGALGDVEIDSIDGDRIMLKHDGARIGVLWSELHARHGDPEAETHGPPWVVDATADEIRLRKRDDIDQDKVAKVMAEFKAGRLKSSSGAVVTDRKQALAIALSEASRTEKKASIRKVDGFRQHMSAAQKREQAAFHQVLLKWGGHFDESKVKRDEDGKFSGDGTGGGKRPSFGRRALGGLGGGYLGLAAAAPIAAMAIKKPGLALAALGLGAVGGFYGGMKRTSRREQAGKRTFLPTIGGLSFGGPIGAYLAHRGSKNLARRGYGPDAQKADLHLTLLKADDKDGRAGRDADSDGKFNEGKEGEGGDTRAAGGKRPSFGRRALGGLGGGYLGLAAAAPIAAMAIKKPGLALAALGLGAVGGFYGGMKRTSRREQAGKRTFLPTIGGLSFGGPIGAYLAHRGSKNLARRGYGPDAQKADLHLTLLKADDKDGRAGRDADSDGKFNEGKEGEGGDTRGHGVKRDATEKPANPRQIDTTSRAGYEARRRADEGYRAETTQVIPEQRGQLYGAIAGGAVGGAGFGFFGAAQAFPELRNGVASRVGGWFENMASAVGGATGRAAATIVPGSPAFRAAARLRSERVGYFLGRNAMKAVNAVYYYTKGKIGDAAVSAARGNKWVAAAGLGVAAGVGGVALGARYGGQLGSIHDALYPYRRVEKGDGFWAAAGALPMTFGQAVDRRPMTFSETLEKNAPKNPEFEAKIKRDEIGRFTFKDAAGALMLAGAAIAGAAGGYFFGQRGVRKALEAVIKAKGPVTKKALSGIVGKSTSSTIIEAVSAAGRYLGRLANATSSQAAREISKVAKEFAEASLIGKAGMLRGAAKTAAFVVGGVYLASEIIKRGVVDLDFVPGGIAGSLKIRDSAGLLADFASFNTATGEMKLPGLIPGKDRQTTYVVGGGQGGAKSDNINYRGDAKDLSPEQRDARRRSAYTTEYERLTKPSQIDEYAKSEEARIDDIIGIGDDKENGWYTSDKKELIRLVEFSGVPSSKRPSGQYEIAQYLERRIGAREDPYPNDRGDLADYHRTLVRYIGSDLPQVQRDQLFSRINAKTPQGGWLSASQKQAQAKAATSPPASPPATPRPSSPPPASSAPAVPKEERRLERNIAAVAEKRSEGKMIWDRAGITREQWDAMPDTEKAATFGRFAKVDIAPLAKRWRGGNLMRFV